MRNLQAKNRYWAVLATKSASGGEAIRNVSRQGFDYYHPKFREPPVRGVRKVAPLFPGYLFVNVFRKDDRVLHSTKDVRQVVGYIRRVEIERFRSLENASGYVEPEFAQPPAFSQGEPVEAIRGIFHEQFGTYVGLADTRGGHRVRVLFEILGREIEHEISAFDLQSAAA